MARLKPPQKLNGVDRFKFQPGQPYKVTGSTVYKTWRSFFTYTGPPYRGGLPLRDPPDEAETGTFSLDAVLLKTFDESSFGIDSVFISFLGEFDLDAVLLKEASASFGTDATVLKPETLPRRLPTYIAVSNMATGSGNSGPSAFGRHASTQTGDLMVATISGTSGTTSIPSGWTLVHQHTVTSITISLLWKVATSSEPATYSFGSHGFGTGSIATFRNVDAVHTSHSTGGTGSGPVVVGNLDVPGHVVNGGFHIVAVAIHRSPTTVNTPGGYNKITEVEAGYSGPAGSKTTQAVYYRAIGAGPSGTTSVSYSTSSDNSVGLGLVIYGLLDAPGLDAIFLATLSGSFGLDAEIVSVVSGSFGIDAIQTETFEASFGLDAISGSTVSDSFGLDAVVLVPSVDFSVDATIRKIASATLGIDAWIVGINTISTTLGIDARITGASTKGGNGNGNGNSASLTINRPSSAGAGDVLIAVIGDDAGSETTVTPPGGWTHLGRFVSSSILGQSAYSKVLGQGEPASYTWNFTGQPKKAGVIGAFTNTGNTVLVYGGQTNASSKNITAPSINVPVAPALLIGLFGTKYQTEIYSPIGMVEPPNHQASSTGAQSASNKNTVQMSIGTVTNTGPTGVRVATADNAAVNIGQMIAIAFGNTQFFDFSANAVVLRPQSGAYGLSAVQRENQSASFGIDALFVEERFYPEADFSANAVLLADQRDTFSLNAVVQQSYDAGFGISAISREGRTGGFDVEAVFLSPKFDSLGIDATLFKTIQSPFGLNAVLYKTLLDSFSLDAVQRQTFNESLDLTAWLRLVVSQSVGLNAIQFKTIEAFFDLGAVLSVPHPDYIESTLEASVEASLTGSTSRADLTASTSGSTAMASTFVAPPTAFTAEAPTLSAATTFLIESNFGITSWIVDAYFEISAWIEEA